MRVGGLLMRNNFNSKKGSALLSVLIMTSILSIFGLLILGVSLAETKYAVYMEKNSQAYYVARAGADAMAEYIIKNPDELNNVVAKPGEGEIAGGRFKTTVYLQGSDIYIESKGTLENIPEATVTLVLRKSYGAFDHAVFSDEDLSLENSIIAGDAGTNSSKGNSMKGKAKVDGEFYTGPETTIDSDGDYSTFDKADKIGDGSITGNITILEEEIVFPPIDLSNFPDATNMQELPNTVDQTGYYSAIKKSVTFNTGSGSKLWVRVDKIDLKGNDYIKITGDADSGGELHILITDSISFGGTTNIILENNAKVFIYYSGTEDVVISGSSNFQGIIYAPDANVDWNGGGGVNIINGSIIAKKVDIASSSDIEIIYNGGLDLMGLSIDNIAVYRRYEYVE